MKNMNKIEILKKICSKSYTEFENYSCTTCSAYVDKVCIYQGRVDGYYTTCDLRKIVDEVDAITVEELIEYYL